MLKLRPAFAMYSDPSKKSEQNVSAKKSDEKKTCPACPLCTKANKQKCVQCPYALNFELQRI